MLIWELGTGVCTLAKTHHAVYLQSGYFIIYKLFLYKNSVMERKQKTVRNP